MQKSKTLEEISEVCVTQNSSCLDSIIFLDKFLNDPTFNTDPYSLDPKQQKKPSIMTAFLRSRADSNRCRRFCRPLPSHSATGPLECKISGFFLFSQIFFHILIYFFQTGFAKAVCKAFFQFNSSRFVNHNRHAPTVFIVAAFEGFSAHRTLLYCHHFRSFPILTLTLFSFPPNGGFILDNFTSILSTNG
jgi:hypothetical protein